MKALSTLLLAAGVLLAGLANRAAATVLTFDDLTVTPDPWGGQQMPSTYAGFNWDPNLYYFNNADYQDPSVWGNTGTDFASDPYALSNYTDVVTISSATDTPFNFTGAYFAGFMYENAVQSYTATSLTITGYNHATEVGSVTIGLPTPNFEWRPINLNGVTSLTFDVGNSEPGTYWLMDNVNYTVFSNDFHDDRHGVPDAGATSVLLGWALVSLAICSRNFRRRTNMAS